MKVDIFLEIMTMLEMKERLAIVIFSIIMVRLAVIKEKTVSMSIKKHLHVSPERIADS